jgi:hypothetical protein
LLDFVVINDYDPVLTFERARTATLKLSSGDLASPPIHFEARFETGSYHVEGQGSFDQYLGRVRLPDFWMHLNGRAVIIRAYESMVPLPAMSP